MAVVVAALLATSTAVLLVMVVALVRHARRLSGALERFREEVDPLLQDIRADADRARDRLEGLSSRGALPRVRPGPSGGAGLE